MNVRLLVMAMALAIGISAPFKASAEVVADWGTVVTPLSTEATFSFAQYDVTNNFTDQYAFSLEGDSGATYTVTFSFDTCKNGCGNPDLSYGIYDANGGLIEAVDGSITLSSGNYVFQVKGDGMGSGNTLDYWGSVTFTATAAATTLVSPVPEPSQILYLLPGLALVRWVSQKRRGRSPAEITLVQRNLAIGQAA